MKRLTENSTGLAPQCLHERRGICAKRDMSESKLPEFLSLRLRIPSAPLRQQNRQAVPPRQSNHAMA